MSQSLLHQVTYSDLMILGDYKIIKEMSQSLLHQVTYSDIFDKAVFRSLQRNVSIPFTSGHVFRPHLARGEKYTDGKVSIPFTSGHVFRREAGGRQGRRDQPVSIPFTSGHVFRPTASPADNIHLWSLNPFYIRSRIPTSATTSPRPSKPIVSIPFTSGHVFRQLGDPRGFTHVAIVSQSLLHQVTYSDSNRRLAREPLNRCLNPFYIRSRIPTRVPRHPTKFSFSVSIPFTSGHVFRQWSRSSATVVARGCLNPFYIRSRIPTAYVEADAANTWKSQSLLHQVTYSDNARQ